MTCLKYQASFFCDLGNIMIPCKELVNGLYKLFVC